MGIRTPSWDFSDHTLAIIAELGLVYDSSLMADDEPYELLADGRPTGIVEIPVEWIRDDAPYFMMERYGGLRPYTPPRSLLDLWRDEFDAAYAEGGLFQLTAAPAHHRAPVPPRRPARAARRTSRATPTSGSPPTRRSPTWRAHSYAPRNTS